MTYYERFKLFSGVCQRRISVIICLELEQARVFVYDANGKQLYDVFLGGKDIRNRQKLPKYLNRIIDNIKILFL